MPDAQQVADIAAALREARAVAGLSQREVAERVGEKQQTVSDWLRGKSEPKLDDIVRLEIALDPSARRGWLLVQAGYVDGPDDAAAAIARDPTLRGRYRTMAREYLDHLRQQSAAETR